MTEHVLIELCAILVFGVVAQWLAWRIHIPSILVLLLTGFLVGPVLSVLHPDDLFGDLLLPIVSISVAIIMFEGGLGLKFSDLKNTAGAVTKLVTVGALATWILATLSAKWLLGMDWSLAILFGGILIVTGPTVILPLLRHIRPVAKVGSVLKWEGILIDPIGALAAVLIFEAIWEAGESNATWLIFAGIGKTIVFGSLFGLAGAAIVYWVLRRYWAPDYLHNPLVLMVVVGIFVLCNHFQHESGLFAVTVMGIVLANQKQVDIQHIMDFKEDLVVLLLSSLFVLLAARIDPSHLYSVSLRSIPFLIVLILFIRPVAVYLSTIGSDLNLKERAFIAWMAPRGIVAAAVASIFALRLEEKGYAGAEVLVPYTFLVIIGTVLVYGLTAGPLGRWLKLAQANPQGILFVGAHKWVRNMAKVLEEVGINVQLVDTNRKNVHDARLEGLQAHYGNALTEYMLIPGIGRLLAMTPNDECNSLAALHFMDEFGRAQVYQLKPDEGEKGSKAGYTPKSLRGRYLFSEEATYSYLHHRFISGSMIKKTNLTEEFELEDLKTMYGEDTLPLFLIDENKRVSVFTADNPSKTEPGQTIICLISKDVPPKANKKKIEAKENL